MANEQNLIPQAHKITVEEASKGGKRSAEVRRQKRDIRKAMEMLLERDFTDKNGNVLSGAETIAAAMFKKALDGNVKAFVAVRDTVGQAPVQKIETVTITQEDKAEVQELIDGITEGCAENLTDNAE